ncbi:MAG: ATP-binding protein [Candidatus Latescibacterota bacterium]
MKKNFSIAVSGKGGVGKSTVAALLVRVLKMKRDGAVLAIDADPNSCLADYLGLTVEENIGVIREEVIKNLEKLPAGMTKERYISFRVQDCIVESQGIDLIELGRPEGPGCYCYINNLLREYESSVHKNYGYIVFDNEAGMEHLSRRATHPLDYLLIVSDVSKPGLKAAKRISELSAELNIVTNKKGLILNRANESLIGKFAPLIEDTGLDVIGYLPEDPHMQEYGINNDSLMDIPEDSSVLTAVREIIEKLNL